MPQMVREQALASVCAATPRPPQDCGKIDVLEPVIHRWVDALTTAGKRRARMHAAHPKKMSARPGGVTGSFFDGSSRDPSASEREPIHVPESIQPHGVRLALAVGRMGTWDLDIGSRAMTWSDEASQVLGGATPASLFGVSRGKRS